MPHFKKKGTEKCFIGRCCERLTSAPSMVDEWNRARNVRSMESEKTFFRGDFSCHISPNAPHVPTNFRGPPSWLWRKCNRLLRLGRPWGAVTLSRWCEGRYIGRWGARRGLKSRSTNYPDHGHHGDPPHSPVTYEYTKTHLDTIYLSYRNVQRIDTANPLQFVTRRHFYRFNSGIYFGEKSFADIQYVHVLGGNPGWWKPHCSAFQDYWSKTMSVLWTIKKKLN